jgi:acetate---CoA ligase (ADP-forming)
LTASAAELRPLLRPESVAVVGATERPGSYGAQALLNLSAIGFRGEVWGVNPARTSVFGKPCVPTMADLPAPVDAVVVAVPAAAVAEVVEQAGAMGCGAAVVISAGFAEVAAGEALQRALVAAAARHALPVCGPNCNGIVAAHARCALWGDALVPREAGSVALISQSGNVAVNALAARRGLRFHTVIASGNQAVLSAADYLLALADAPGVASVALYLEDDGGAELCDALARCAEAGVRVAVLKVGDSPAGARAAAAHSAALAGDQRIFRSLVEEAGAAWARDVHELLELAKTLAVPRPPRTPRGASVLGGVAIMTCSGGDSAQGADEAARLGLELPELAPETKARLAAALPPAATVANPIDYTAMIWGDRDALAELIRIVAEDPGVDDVVVFYDQPAGLSGAVEESWRAVREGIAAGAAHGVVPTLVSSTLPELLDDDAGWQLIQTGVPAAAGLRTGLRCLQAARQPVGEPARLRAIGARARALASLRRQASGSAWLPEHEAKRLLRDADVPVVEGRLVADERDAVAALIELGGATVLKLSAASVQHKSELGAVVLDLRTEDGVRAAYAHVAALAERHRGEVLAERMEMPAVELLIAASSTGIVPALILGLGGTWTELLDDVAIVPLPATAARVERALRSLRGAPVLTGGRGRAAVDIAAATALAARLGELLLEGAFALIECNPVLVAPDGALVLDATIRRFAGPAAGLAPVPSETRMGQAA